MTMELQPPTKPVRVDPETHSILASYCRWRQGQELRRFSMAEAVRELLMASAKALLADGITLGSHQDAQGGRDPQAEGGSGRLGHPRHGGAAEEQRAG